MLVHDVRIFDGVEVIPHGSVLVEDGRVAADTAQAEAVKVVTRAHKKLIF